MKTAIFVYGEYRQFELAVKTYKPFYESYNPDYYVATWDYSCERSTKYDYNISYDVTEQMILKHLPDSTISIKHPPDIGFWIKIYTLLKQCVEMCLASGNEYDLIIVKRIDAIECFNHNIYESLQANTIYIEDEIKSDRDGNPIFDDFSDCFFYGSANSMISFITNFHKKYILGNLPIAVHQTPVEYLYLSDIHIEQYNIIGVWIIRPTMIELFKEYESSTTWNSQGINSTLCGELDDKHGEWYVKIRPYRIV